jgi:hypothetical protein
MAGKYAALYEKALNDPKYAEYKRRELVGFVKTAKKEVIQLKNVIAAVKKDTVANDKEIQVLAKRLNDLDANGDNVVDNPANATEFNTKTAQLKKAKIERTTLKNQLTAAEQELKAETSRLAIQNQTLTKLDEITGVTSNTAVKGYGDSGGKGDNTSNNKNKTTLSSFKYNAPMVKASYFTGNSIQANSTPSGGKGMYPTAMKNAQFESFKNNGNRGAIQMSSETHTYLKDALKKYKGVKWDATAYGFRFHYNPTSVEMTYGQMMDVAPEALRDDSRNFNAITPLNVGGLSFTLYLNRIYDMNYVTSAGRLEDPLTGETITDTTTIYPTPVTARDIREIYKKGTMYDLEYLFRSIHTGSNDYNSLLRGRTSDIGWLTGVAVDLHLGDGLRYTVRINGISVNHAMFNDRMVPTLTTVNINCSRFYDMPGVVKSGGGGGGGGGAQAVL